MVIWSFLLLGLPVNASLDGVFAPVDKYVDDLDLLAEIERQLTDRIQPAGVLRLIPVSQMPRLTDYDVMPEVILTDPPSQLRSSLIFVQLRLMDGDRILGNHIMQFRVQVMAEVWVPARRLAIGERLASADVEIREVDLIREPKAVPADASIFGCYEMARPVSAGRALSWSDIAARELVKAGGSTRIRGHVAPAVSVGSVSAERQTR